MSARLLWILGLVVVILLAWWASGLGRVPAEPRRFFTEEQIVTADRYQGPRQVTFGVGTVLGLAVLAALTFTRATDLVVGAVRTWPGPFAAGAVAIAVGLAVAVVRLPLAFWRGYVHERAWGFSTQSVSGWFADWAKGLGISTLLSVLVIVGLVVLIRLLPRSWPVAAAIAGALLVVVLSYLAPVVFEPVFNKFTPLADRRLAGELKELAERAGVPVREVLVSDASRRTTKENAYVSGIGNTRRLVLYDTLLSKAEEDELKLVVAHELGHRRARHVELGTALGALATAAGVLILWLLLRPGAGLGWVGASAPADPRIVPLVLLVVAVLSLVTLPPSNWLSRRFERSADRFALELTGDRDAYVRTERGLALRNLSDLDPGPVVYRFLFTHPAPSERIALAGPGESQ